MHFRFNSLWVLNVFSKINGHWLSVYINYFSYPGAVIYISRDSICSCFFYSNIDYYLVGGIAFSILYAYLLHYLPVTDILIRNMSCQTQQIYDYLAGDKLCCRQIYQNKKGKSLLTEANIITWYLLESSYLIINRYFTQVEL